MVNCLRYLSEDLEELDPEDAALLDGWSEAHTRLIAARHREQRDANVNRLRAALGDDQFTRLREEGRRMGVDDIVRTALAAIDRLGRAMTP